MFNPFYLLLASIRAIILIVSLILILPCYIFITKFFVKNTPAFAFKIRRMWVYFAKFVLGIKCEITGSPLKDRSALYVCNHRSFSDPLIIAAALDAYVIAKAEVDKIPLIGKGASMTGIIYVKRENKDSRSAVRELMTKVLLDNKNVLVFPEGTVRDQLSTLPYKKGTFIEAAKHNIPVVPITLEYKKKKDLWFEHSMVAHHFKQFGPLITSTKLHFGPAMTDTDGLMLAESAESWTNKTIVNIHKDWASDFHEEATQQQTS